MSGAITLKLTSLLIRTVAKPFATTIKAQSKQSPLLKTNFIRFGQFINRVDLTLRNSSNSTLKIRPLTDNKAIELGSNFLSELFVFSIAAGLIIYESNRSKSDKSDKSETPEPVPTPQTASGQTASGGTGATSSPTSTSSTSTKSGTSSSTPAGAVDSKDQSVPKPTLDSLQAEITKLQAQNSIILAELAKLQQPSPKNPEKTSTSPVNSKS